MAFSAGTSSGPSAEINVTPLIDVLLVLLIIFMVIVPVMPRGLSALAPQPSKDRAAAPESPLVVQVRSAPGSGVTYQINQQSVEKAALGRELGRVLAGRQDKAMFVHGDRDLEYAAVAEVIDLSRQAGADRVGILTPALEAGH